MLGAAMDNQLPSPPRIFLDFKAVGVDRYNLENVLDLALDAALEKALFELVGVRGGERELFVRARFTREE